MSKIKAPKEYIQKENIIYSAGEYIGKLGKKAIVIGSYTALAAVDSIVWESLENAGVEYQVHVYSGYCTEESIQAITGIAVELQADVIVGIGGGTVLDSTKAVGENIGVPVVTIPTIAATCAAWSALTVLYNDKGAAVGYKILKESPHTVLVDPNILVKAPSRYLAAGIADTIVKWYEIAPHISNEGNDVAFQTSLTTAKLALDILLENGAAALQDNKKARVTKEFTKVVDAIIMLAGMVGSIKTEKPRAAIAHSIHNSITAIPGTAKSLHGEKVGFGLIAQLILEGKPDEEVAELISILHKWEGSITLEQLEVQHEKQKQINRIAASVKIREEAIRVLDFEVNEETLINAIEKANAFGEKIVERALNTSI
ncbi:iron-containing alcohol dehydrogenase family protein [Niallia sp. 01092]|uniref:iron-containing alcohol dehydrogenase family protein n=1 Tax=unclassified Niallia TaxID=2837522 RepID=UPI003FD23CE6